MDIDGVIDRLERAYADAGLPPIRQADGAVHSVTARIAAEIAPLELPAELGRFWSRIDPHSLAGAPYPRPTDPSFALDTWLAHRDETPGMVPRLLFPVCYEWPATRALRERSGLARLDPQPLAGAPSGCRTARFKLETETTSLTSLRNRT
jgi:hypothetical protein